MQKITVNAKNGSRALSLLLALMMIVFVATGCSNNAQSSGGTETKTVTLTVTHRDGSTKEFTVKTSQEMLGAALQDEKLIEGTDGQYGLFVTTVDGETVDDSAQEWWCLTKGGQQVNTGVDSTPAEDGAAYEFTLTVGY